MKKSILLLIVTLLPLFANAQSQNRQTQQAISALKRKLDSVNQNKVRWITAKDLHDATLISYYLNNGAVAPDYQWACTIEVSPQYLSVIVSGGFSRTEVYRESVGITNKQFAKLKQEIVSVGIGKNNCPADFLPAGGGASRFEIKKGSNIVFSADNEYIECKQGSYFNITTIFNELLTEKMKIVVKDPGEIVYNYSIIDTY